MIFFDTRRITTKNIPYWFAAWWDHFGSCVEYLNDIVRPSLQVFTKMYSPTDEEKIFSEMMIFHMKFYLPWVFQWRAEYTPNIKVPLIKRKFYIKWWIAFNIPESIYPHKVMEQIKIWNAQKQIADSKKNNNSTGESRT